MIVSLPLLIIFFVEDFKCCHLFSTHSHSQYSNGKLGECVSDATHKHTSGNSLSLPLFRSVSGSEFIHLQNTAQRESSCCALCLSHKASQVFVTHTHTQAHTCKTYKVQVSATIPLEKNTHKNKQQISAEEGGPESFNASDSKRLPSYFFLDALPQRQALLKD